MNVLELVKPLKYVFLIGFILIVYGILSRVCSINFFWESDAIGYNLLLLGLIGLIRNGLKKRKKANKDTKPNLVGIGFIVFILFMEGLMYVILPRVDAYKEALRYIKEDKVLHEEIGEFTGYSLIPVGGISTVSNSNGNMGNATFKFIIKGENEYKDITVFLRKNYDTDWQVIGIK